MHTLALTLQVCDSYSGLHRAKRALSLRRIDAPVAGMTLSCDGQVRKQVEPASLYSACRQWVQNEPDIEAQPQHAPGVRNIT